MNKYRNVKTVVDGISFDSKKEAKEYGQIRMRLLAKEILAFSLQETYLISINGVKVCSYIADFKITLLNGLFEVIDVKSEITRKNPVYRIKKKLMLAVYGIEIIEK